MTLNTSSYMELRSPYWIAIAIIIGLSVGYGGASFQSQSVIETQKDELLRVESEFNALKAEYDSLMTEFKRTEVELSALHDDYSELEKLYHELSIENVPIEDYNDLIENNQELTEEISELTSDLASLYSDYIELNSTYHQMQTQYEDLLEEYYLLNGPSSSFATVDDLDIIFSTDKTVYNYTEPITGTVSIYYKDGEPFQGKVSFSIQTGSHGATEGYTTDIKGETDFYIDLPAFRYGPAIYYFKLAKIETSSGYYIAGGNELENTTIILEAK